MYVPLRAQGRTATDTTGQPEVAVDMDFYNEEALRIFEYVRINIVIDTIYHARRDT